MELKTLKVPFVDFGAQYSQHKEEYDKAIQGCLTSGRLILQKELGEFEQNLADFLGMKYAVGLNSGTDALFLGLKVLKPTEPFLLTSGYTFKATHEAIAHNDIRPELLDVDDNRLALNADVPVHIEGMVAHSDNAIMEDACQALGAKGIGYSGHIALSFYPAKILGGFGDGGAFVTNDKKAADQVRLYRHHWQTNEGEKMAYNSRLDNVQAAFLNVKLKHLPEILKRREEIAEMYKALPKEIKLPYYQEGRVWQDYVIEVDPADVEPLTLWLTSNGIQTLGHGMTPPNVAQKTGKRLLKTEMLYASMLRLPCNETLTNEQIQYVIDKITEYYGVPTV